VSVNLCPVPWATAQISHVLQHTKRNSAKSKWPLWSVEWIQFPYELTCLEVFEPIDAMLDLWNVKTPLGGPCLWWPRSTWLQGKILVERCEWLEMPMCKSQGLDTYIYICIDLESLILQKSGNSMKHSFINLIWIDFRARKFEKHPRLQVKGYPSVSIENWEIGG